MRCNRGDGEPSCKAESQEQRDGFDSTEKGYTKAGINLVGKLLTPDR